jgi:FtsH-binding integral membrane protein
VLRGFVATDFIITITLSAADATAHAVENPFVPHSLHHPVIITLVLISLLGAVFLKGFKEANGVAVILVILYLGSNVLVIGTALYHIAQHPELFPNWWQGLYTTHGSPLAMIGLSVVRRRMTRRDAPRYKSEGRSLPERAREGEREETLAIPGRIHLLV